MEATWSTVLQEKVQRPFGRVIISEPETVIPDDIEVFGGF